MRFIELFAGIGLFRYGLESLGKEWCCVFANDISEMKARAYALNFGTADLWQGDIHNLSASQLPNAELLTASFPCQDLSLAGNRGGLSAERSGTVHEVIRLLRELKAQNRAPQAVILENVTGLLTSHNGHDIRVVLDMLSGLGYGLDLLLLDAAYWLPQSRPRLFIVGRLGADSSPATPPHAARPVQIQWVIQANADLKWALLDLPELPAKSSQTLADFVHSEGAKWFEDAELERELGYIRNSSRQRLEVAQDAAGRDGMTRYLPGYRRMRKGEVCLELRDDGLAGCLRTPSGGSSRQLLVEVRPQQTCIRLMTPREYARLMGVPDTFQLPENTREALFGCGDAVVVPVIQWLGRALKAQQQVPRHAPAPLLEPAV